MLGDNKDVSKRVGKYFKKSLNKKMPLKDEHKTEEDIMKELEEWVESFF